jgi:two-component system nitrogen regulation response regulator NtrX
VDQFSREHNLRPKRLAPAALEVLRRHRWKGNIRELRNTIERLVIMSPGDEIGVEGLPEAVRGDGSGWTADTRGGGPRAESAVSPGTLRGFKEAAERQFLVEKLREHGWNISKTAEIIGTPRSNLYKKLEQYNISQEVDG